MIKTEELRLGNIIYGVSDRIETVTAITKTHITSFPGKITQAEMSNNPNHLNPIKLTEEILIQIGFKRTKAKSGVVKAFILHGIRLNMSTMQNFYNNGKSCNYLHTLQNIYFAKHQEELITINPFIS